MKPTILLLVMLLLLTGHTLRTAWATEGALAPAAGRFLVAQRDLYAPYFSRSVVYLIQHDATGTVGVIINRPLGRNAAEVLPDLQSIELGSYPVYTGGPVNPRIVVMLFRGSYPTELALHVAEDVYASSAVAMLAQMKTEHKPAHELRMFAGQAGWAPGQLAQELVQGSWYVTEGDPDVIFSSDTDRLWSRLINRLDPLGIMVHAADPASGAPRL